MLSTFLDLYALDTDFPAFEESRKKPDVYLRVQCLQDALSAAIVATNAKRAYYQAGNSAGAHAKRLGAPTLVLAVSKSF